MDIQGAEDKLMTTGSNAGGETAQVAEEEEGTEDIILQITKEDNDAKYKLHNS